MISVANGDQFANLKTTIFNFRLFIAYHSDKKVYNCSSVFAKRHSFFLNEALCSTCNWKCEKFLKMCRLSVMVHAYAWAGYSYLTHQGHSHNLQL